MQTVIVTVIFVVCMYFVIRAVVSFVRVVMKGKSPCNCAANPDECKDKCASCTEHCPLYDKINKTDQSSE